MNEAELCRKIVDSANEDENIRLKSPELGIPSGNTNQILTNVLFSEILNFFNEEVIPFSHTLKNISDILSNKPDSDTQKFFEEVNSKTESIASLGEIIVKKIPKSTSNKIKELFRYVLWPSLKESYFVSRGLLKPHGFPGDYIIIEAMYNENAKSTGLGYIYDLIFLKTQLCRGLRNRKDQMKQVLNNYLDLNYDKSLAILNIGCGGSRELKELAIPEKGKGLSIYLMDFDSRAIQYSIERLGNHIAKSRIIPINVDVRKLISQEKIKRLGINPCDFIYSIGLFDYLPDKILVRLIQNMVSLLKANGKFVFAHKDYTAYDPKIADWFCDWKYYPRTQKDIEEILVSLNIEQQNVVFTREKDGYIFFAEITKSEVIRNNAGNR